MLSILETEDECLLMVWEILRQDFFMVEWEYIKELQQDPHSAARKLNLIICLNSFLKENPKINVSLYKLLNGEEVTSIGKEGRGGLGFYYGSGMLIKKFLWFTGSM